MTKIVVVLVLIFATVSPVAMALSVLEAPVAEVCEAPKAVAVRKALAPKPIVAPAKLAAILPAVGWPDWLVGVLAAVVLLLALAVAFLLGRVTAPVANQPQVVAPVVYVQPPPVPAPPAPRAP